MLLSPERFTIFDMYKYLMNIHNVIIKHLECENFFIKNITFYKIYDMIKK